jgi:hypothetical protein
MIFRNNMVVKCCHLAKAGVSVFFIFFFSSCYAQTISQAEYFFDTDPGPGNGTPISFTPGDPVTITGTISTTGLEGGYHLLYVRTRTSTGQWSLYEPQAFHIASSIEAAEYFFDTDPGPGNGTPLSFGAGDPVTFTETINTTGLEPGYHLLHIRTRSTTGEWSLYEPQEFIIDGGIIAAEYFFDTDPGIGNGTSLSITPVTSTITPSISTSALEDGEHFLFIRTRHDDDTWSLSDPQVFYIRTRIVEAEYFIDADPGFGNGTPLSVTTPSDLITIAPTLTTPTLPDGDHYLFIRTKDIRGRWSHFEPMMFTVDAALPVELFDFIATATRDGRVKLQWTTVTEVNNNFFTVEHAVPALEFNELFDVPGAGTSTRTIDYEKMHDHPDPGTNYYRLKQTDFDGTFSYSKVVSAQVTKGTSVYPNPISDTGSIEFGGDGGPEMKVVEILDLTGRKLVAYQTQQTKLDFTREGIPPGAHILRITYPDARTEFLKINFR